MFGKERICRQVLLIARQYARCCLLPGSMMGIEALCKNRDSHIRVIAQFLRDHQYTSLSSFPGDSVVKTKRRLHPIT